MPVYRYRARDPATACEQCREGYELIQRMRDRELDQCSACGAPVERVIFAPFVQGGDSHRLKEGHLDRHGFTQYRKVEKGVYEKTAGKGPDRIKDDGR